MPFTNEAYIAPLFAIVKEPNANARALISMNILSIGEGRKAFETKAAVSSKVATVDFFVIKMFSTSLKSS